MNSLIIDECVYNKFKVTVVMNVNWFDGVNTKAYSHTGTIKRSDCFGILLEREEKLFCIPYANIVEIELEVKNNE